MEIRKQYMKEFKLDAISLVLEQEEIRRFKIENKQLKLERQILKEWSFCERNEVKYSFITQKKKTYPMGLFCRLLDVSRSAYLSI